MKAIPFLLLLLFFSYWAKAQSNSGGLKPGFQITYFGRLFTHPGIKFSFSIPSFTNNKEYINGLPVKTTHQVFFNISGGYYFHKGNHHGFFFSTDFAYRMSFKNGFFWDVTAGAGLLRTVLDGETIVVKDTVLTDGSALEGSTYFMPSLFLGFGKNIRNTDNKVKGWNVKVGSFWQSPFNGNTLLNPALQAGIHNYSIKK